MCEDSEEDGVHVGGLLLLLLLTARVHSSAALRAARKQVGHVLVRQAGKEQASERRKERRNPGRKEAIACSSSRQFATRLFVTAERSPAYQWAQKGRRLSAACLQRLVWAVGTGVVWQRPCF